MDLTNELNTMNEADQASNLAAAQKEITALVDKLYSSKLEADKAAKKFKELKAELTLLMNSAGVDKILGKECSITKSIKNSVTVPKDLPSKMELFKYIIAECGREVFDEMITIAAGSFNSWYDIEVERHVQAGEIDFKLDMLKPYERESLSIRKITKKAK